GGDAGGCLAVRVGPGLVDGAEFLRVPLVQSARDGEVPVHPDVDAARVDPALEGAPDHDEALLVLGAHRVQQFLATGRAGLPVGPDDRHGAGVVGGGGEGSGEQFGDVFRIGAVFDGQQVARVVPGRGWDEGGASGGGPRVEEA